MFQQVERIHGEPLLNHRRIFEAGKVERRERDSIARCFDSHEGAFVRPRDVVVSTVDDDTNYLLAQLASERGTAQIATVVDDPAVVELFEESGLDVIIHPQDIIAGEILQVVYQEGATDVTVLDHDNAEVFETIVDGESLLAGSSLADIANKLPSGFVVGAIIRGDTLRTPRGGTIIQTGDHVIGFVDAEVATEVAEKI